MLLQASTSMIGIINFRYGLGTGKLAVIQLIGLHVVFSLLFVSTFSIVMI